MDRRQVLPLPFPHEVFNPLTLFTLMISLGFPNVWTKTAFFSVCGVWCLACKINASGDLMRDYLDAQNAMFVLTRGVGMLICWDPAGIRERRRGKGWGGRGYEVGGKTGGNQGRAVEGGGKRVEDMDFWEKLWRGWRIFVAYRGYGWSFQVNGIPPAKPQGYPRMRFILENLATSVVYLVYLDTGLAWLRGYTPFGDRPVRANVYEQGFLMRLACATILGSSVYCLGTVVTAALASTTVLLGFCEPADWPPTFGPLWEAYSVRRFWSYVWHQAIRLSVEPMARVVVYDVLRLNRESGLGGNAKACVCFFISFICHAFGSWAIGMSFYNEFRFFMSQFIAIVLEETVLDRLTFKPGTRQNRFLLRILGYVWTAAWVLTGVAFWTNTIREKGFALEDQVDLGIGKLVLQRVVN